MQVKRILNRVQKHQGFVYTDMELTQEKEPLVLNITVEPRKNSRAVCSGCGATRAGYDRLGPRRFEFIPFWGILVYFVYAMRRVECPTCGIKVEGVPWAEGKRTATTAYAWFPARWAKQLFRWFGQERTAGLRYVCSDMWRPYLSVVAKKASQAIHILDRFHIMSHLSKAIDEVRAGEAKELVRQGYEPVLKKTRWLLLKRPENLTDKQAISLRELLQYNLKTVRSYLLKEEFQLFWEYCHAPWAGRFLDRWCTRAMRSRIEPMKKVARMLRGHRELILNWFRAKKAFSSGVVEGLNAKAKVATRRAYGFKVFKTLELALYHNLGALPEPETAHRFF